jgi:hypothetical protein
MEVEGDLVDENVDDDDGVYSSDSDHSQYSHLGNEDALIGALLYQLETEIEEFVLETNLVPRATSRNRVSQSRRYLVVCPLAKLLIRRLTEDYIKLSFAHGANEAENIEIQAQLKEVVIKLFLCSICHPFLRLGRLTLEILDLQQYVTHLTISIRIMVLLTTCLVLSLMKFKKWHKVFFLKMFQLKTEVHSPPLNVC